MSNLGPNGGDGPRSSPYRPRRTAQGKKKTILARSLDKVKHGVFREGKERRTSDLDRGSVDSLASAGSEGDDTQGRWDLDSCVDVIETVQGLEGLTPEQRAAIDHLRAATGHANQTKPIRTSGSGGSGRSRGSGRRREVLLAHRREAKFFGRGSLGLTKELLQCFREVEQDKDDTDLQSNVTAILGTFGGQIFDGVSSIAPRRPSDQQAAEATRSKSRGSEELVGRSAHSIESDGIDDLNRSLTMDSLHRVDLDRIAGRKTDTRRTAAVGIDPLDFTDSLASFFVSEGDDSSAHKVYCPPEWNKLTKEARTKLTKLLAWDNLARWDFNVLDVAEASRDEMLCSSMSKLNDTREGQICPLLFVGWAVLCAPAAQQAMEGSLGDNSKPEGGSQGHVECYGFVDDLLLSPEAVCNFLREIERLYHHEVPYHNNVHAADVTQTLHCLLQFMGQGNLEGLFDPVETFSLLLAATFHDVGHEGTNNLFQQNARTDMAIRYNDLSILENMHSAVGHAYLMGKKRKSEWDVLKNWSEGQKDKARQVMMRAVLGTDMSKHFESVGGLASQIEKMQANVMENEASNGALGLILTPDGAGPHPILSILVQASDQRRKNFGVQVPSEEDCTHLTQLILKFLLHAADISNPTKNRDMAIYWADQALAEFFAQGDEEEEKGIPISPLCDRRTVKRADSQIGFLKFVVRPTYVLLGDIIPRVKEDVLPIIDDNIRYWTRTKARLSGMRNNQMMMGMAIKYSKAKNRKSSIEEGEEGDESDDGTSESEENIPSEKASGEGV